VVGADGGAGNFSGRHTRYLGPDLGSTSRGHPLSTDLASRRRHSRRAPVAQLGTPRHAGTGRSSLRLPRLGGTLGNGSRFPGAAGFTRVADPLGRSRSGSGLGTPRGPEPGGPHNARVGSARGRADRSRVEFIGAGARLGGSRCPGSGLAAGLGLGGACGSGRTPSLNLGGTRRRDSSRAARAGLGSTGR
jgi:hypothetical protein